MIATPTTTLTFTANRTTTIAPSTPPTMATVTTDGGDAVGKARGMAEDGGGAYAGLDSLLMPPPPARLSNAAAATTATSSYSRSVVPHR